MTVSGTLDPRFSEASEPLDWATVTKALTDAELYWLTTVRSDGRPHVTPLVGVWADDGFVFCTGPGEQKAHNLSHHADVAVTTGVNTWNDGLDVVVEGSAERVTGQERLAVLAADWYEKYSGEWDFAAGEDGFGEGDELAFVFKVQPVKVIAFAKAPHGQTTFAL
jgi:pyridoxine/pyridoxamine 5'-phosphate oxidase